MGGDPNEIIERIELAPANGNFRSVTPRPAAPPILRGCKCDICKRDRQLYDYDLPPSGMDKYLPSTLMASEEVMKTLGVR